MDQIMMNAIEAREKSELARHSIFDKLMMEVTETIERAVKDGQRSVVFDIPPKYSFFDQEVMKILSEHNYETKMNNGHLIIQW